ncbi:MAG: hypothetical protein M3Q06_05585 [Bacteroidota bacterium]|nr:hypothetical protein [Bacteroidota bacterium]
MKQDSFAIDKETAFTLKTASERMTVAGMVVTIGVAFAVSIGLFLFWKHPFSVFAVVLIFFAAGLLHIFPIVKTSYSLASSDEWRYTLLATGAILALLALFSIWQHDFTFHLALSSAGAFLLPLPIMEMWRAYIQLALEGAKVWYPTKEILAKYPTFYFNSTPMRFHVLQGRGKPNVTIDFKVSNEMPLGKIYYDLVENKLTLEGKPVTLVDALQRHYHWVFFTREWIVLTRALDPEKTLHENGLDETNRIYVQKLTLDEISDLNEQKQRMK